MSRYTRSRCPPPSRYSTSLPLFFCLFIMPSDSLFFQASLLFLLCSSLITFLILENKKNHLFLPVLFFYGGVQQKLFPQSNGYGEDGQWKEKETADLARTGKAGQRWIMPLPNCLQGCASGPAGLGTQCVCLLSCSGVLWYHQLMYLTFCELRVMLYG